jgi:hypothetical protein
MTSPQDLAAQRLEAIAALEAQLAGHIGEAQRLLYEGLLGRLQEIHADPAVLPALLAEYTNTVLLPLAGFYAEQLLLLPGLNVDYFEQLDVAGYQALRAPLDSFLRARLGVDAAGAVVPGGYLALLQGDTSVAKQVLTYAYQAQASGAGLPAYRDGLNALILGGDPVGLGVVQGLYRSSGDDFAQADRALQTVAARELGLTAFLYQGGLIDSSRPFCVARNGKVFLDFEIAKFGTPKDPYGGYSNKSQGLFSGKPDPYDPMLNCGGYSCRHHWHGVPSVTALRMRPDLGEDKDGKLFIK